MRPVIVLTNSIYSVLFVIAMLFAGDLFALELPSTYALVGVIQAQSEKDSLAVITTPEKQRAFLRVGDRLPGMSHVRIASISRKRITLTDGTTRTFLVHDGSQGGGDRSNEQYASRGNSYDSDSMTGGSYHREDDVARPNWDESMAPVPFEQPYFDESFPPESIPYDDMVNEMQIPLQEDEIQDYRDSLLSPYGDPEGFYPYFNDREQAIDAY